MTGCSVPKRLIFHGLFRILVLVNCIFRNANPPEVHYNAVSWSSILSERQNSRSGCEYTSVQTLTETLTLLVFLLSRHSEDWLMSHLAIATAPPLMVLLPLSRRTKLPMISQRFLFQFSSRLNPTATTFNSKWRPWK